MKKRIVCLMGVICLLASTFTSYAWYFPYTYSVPTEFTEIYPGYIIENSTQKEIHVFSNVDFNGKSSYELATGGNYGGTGGHRVSDSSSVEVDFGKVLTISELMTIHVTETPVDRIYIDIKKNIGDSWEQYGYCDKRSTLSKSRGYITFGLKYITTGEANAYADFTKEFRYLRIRCGDYEQIHISVENQEKSDRYFPVYRVISHAEANSNKNLTLNFSITEAEAQKYEYLLQASYNYFENNLVSATMYKNGRVVKSEALPSGTGFSSKSGSITYWAKRNDMGNFTIQSHIDRISTTGGSFFGSEEVMVTVFRRTRKHTDWVPLFENGHNAKWTYDKQGGYRDYSSEANWSVLYNEPSVKDKYRDYEFNFILHKTQNDYYGIESRAQGWLFRFNGSEGYAVLTDSSDYDKHGLYYIKVVADDLQLTKLVDIPQLGRDDTVSTTWPMNIKVVGKNITVAKQGVEVLNYEMPNDKVLLTGGYGPISKNLVLGLIKNIRINDIGVENYPAEINVNSFPTQELSYQDEYNIRGTVSDKDNDNVGLIYTLYDKDKTLQMGVLSNVTNTQYGVPFDKDIINAISEGGTYDFVITSLEETRFGRGITSHYNNEIVVLNSPLRKVYEKLVAMQLKGESKKLIILNIDEVIVQNANNDMYLEQIYTYLEENSIRIYLIDNGKSDSDYIKQKLLDKVLLIDR